MTTRKPLLIGPFSRGINTYDDPTAIHDQECAQAMNFDPGLDGSLKSRPPFADVNAPFPVVTGSEPRLLGYFYSSVGAAYLIASDGDTRTYQYLSGSWALITSTFAATDMVQFDDKAWLVKPVGESDPGGYWTPGGGFTADSDMPAGTSISAYKSRLWIAEGLGGSNPTRIRYSKVIGQPDFWDNAGFVDVGSGDGQSIVKILTYFDSMLVFRTKSIWSFQYGVDPAQAIQSVTVPGIGLQGKHALVAHENYLYFMYDEKAYSFVNNRAQQVNIKVPFTSRNRGSIISPYTVSLFNNRVLYSFYDIIYVYSLRTNTWTTWQSEAYGPVGQFLMPYVDDNTDIAYALPSGNASPPARNDRNLVWNATFETDARFGAGIDLGMPVRSTSVSGSPHCAVLTVPQPVLLPRRLYTTANMPVTAGEELVLSGKVRLSVTGGSGTRTSSIRAVFVDEDGIAGQVNGTVVGSPIENTTSGRALDTWYDEELSVTVPNGVRFLRLGIGIEYGESSPSAESVQVAVDDLKVGKDNNFFYGGTANGGGFTYSFLGEDNASESVQLLQDSVPLLRIEDRLTLDKEDMTCVLVTKNYNFDVPGSFKVLFWWGVDAIFKKNVQGQVVPGVYSQSTTWGQVRTKTWGDLLSGTWAHPYLSDPSAISDVQTMSGPIRRFVKFFKKLRFRQIYFRVAFRIDGSSDTAPVQIFTLSTYMAEKQTVSKTVS